MPTEVNRQLLFLLVFWLFLGLDPFPGSSFHVTGTGGRQYVHLFQGLQA